MERNIPKKFLSEWQVVFKEPGVILKFQDLRDKVLAHDADSTPGIHIKAFPVTRENLSDKAFMEKFMNWVVDELSDKIYFEVESTSSESIIIELEKYDKETGIANFRAFEVSPEEFEKEMDGLDFLSPGKNELPL